MTRSIQLSFCLVATLCTGTALAQASADQTAESTTATSSPVAYVYVSRPTHVDAFAASSSGKLTAVPGSPFSNIAVSHMSVNKKYLFGAGDDQQNLYTFSIGSNGALKQVAVTNILKDAPDGYGTGPIQIDGTGSTLYNSLLVDDSFVQAFKIEENGELQFVGDTETDDTFDVQEVFPTMISFVGNNKYAFETGCDEDELSTATEVFKRESSGVLQVVRGVAQLPKTKSAGDIYCPFNLATDPTDHLAFVLQDFNVNSGESEGSSVLASYTVDSEGNLTTKSTFENMPAIDTGVSTMSISPSGKLLVVGGSGFQIFHFNGSSPITKYSGVFQPGTQFQEFGWDGDNHLYALGGGELYAYTVTSTSIKEAPGSPHSIPEASSVIVLTK
jgi:6-phosphogluconolactonase (cycloisomerase 2 family)